MLRASVPETTINKYGNPVFGEHKIRFAGQRIIPPPACDALAFQYFYKFQFR